MKLAHWTEEEKQKLITAYNNKISKKDVLAMFRHRTYGAIKHMAKSLKLIKIRNQFKNEAFFKEPNIKNCAIAGIIASDGCILHPKDKNSYRIPLGFSTKDIVFLKKIIEEVSSNANISNQVIRKTIKTKTNKNECKTYYFSSVTFSKAENWVNDLKKNWNIVERKSLVLEPPNITDLELKLAFLCGEISGDGVIGIQKTKDKKYVYITLLGTKNLLLWAKQAFEEFLKEKINSDLVQKDNIYYFRINGKQAIKVFEKMQSLDCVKLERKWYNPEVLQVISDYKSKYPQYFSQENQYNNNMKHKLETNGRENDGKPMLLEQVWGKTDMSRYQTLDESEYTNTISNMTRADLEAHAHKMGVPVCEGSLRLRDMLINEFRSYCSMLKVPKGNLPSKKDFGPEALKIMNEGR